MNGYILNKNYPLHQPIFLKVKVSDSSLQTLSSAEEPVSFVQSLYIKHESNYVGTGVQRLQDIIQTIPCKSGH